MVTSITHGIKISVETFFQQQFSNDPSGEFIFAYRITIENKSDAAVKLLRRHWHIFDTNGLWREVDGEGVVGEQPEISSGGTHQYVSGCHLQSTAGKMYGTYLMERSTDKFLFDVEIPEFSMVAPFMLN